MKIKIKKILALLLIGGGIIVLAYPTISSLVIEWFQKGLVDSYDYDIAGMEKQQRDVQRQKAQEYNEMLNGSNIIDPFIPESGYALPTEYLSVLNVGQVIGSIRIPKINVILPIKHGTSEEVLKECVGHLQNTAFPIGGNGNHAVLTGHRGLPTAKLFTDLDKVEVNDIFYITVLDETLAYKIDQILVVKPSETQELRPVPKKDYVTLVTCTPLGINSHRIFVRGERMDDQPDKNQLKSKEPDIRGGTAAGIVCSIFLVVVIRLAFKKKGK